MSLDFHVNQTGAQLHDVKAFAEASNGEVAWRNERGIWEFTQQNSLPNTKNIVDNTSAPPTEVDGDIYIIDATGTSHADWNGAAANSWVRYFEFLDVWNAIAPTKGLLCFNETDNQYYDFNGTTWAVVSGGGGGGATSELKSIAVSVGDNEITLIETYASAPEVGVFFAGLGEGSPTGITTTKFDINVESAGTITYFAQE